MFLLSRNFILYLYIYYLFFNNAGNRACSLYQPIRIIKLTVCKNALTSDCLSDKKKMLYKTCSLMKIVGCKRSLYDSYKELCTNHKVVALLYNKTDMIFYLCLRYKSKINI